MMGDVSITSFEHRLCFSFCFRKFDCFIEYFILGLLIENFQMSVKITIAGQFVISLDSMMRHISH